MCSWVIIGHSIFIAIVSNKKDVYNQGFNDYFMDKLQFLDMKLNNKEKAKEVLKFLI